MPLVLLMVPLLLGDLDGEGSLDLLLLAGLLFSTLVKLVSVGDHSLLLPLLPGLWSAEAFLAPGCGRGLLESVFCRSVISINKQQLDFKTLNKE